MTAKPVVTTRLAVGDAVELALAGRRAAQTAAARLTTSRVGVVVAWLIDSRALVLLAVEDRHQFLQLTGELVVVDVVSSACYLTFICSAACLLVDRRAVVIFVESSAQWKNVVKCLCSSKRNSQIWRNLGLKIVFRFFKVFL